MHLPAPIYTNDWRGQFVLLQNKIYEYIMMN